MIPVYFYTFLGDVAKALALKGLGKQQMDILVNEMSFNDVTVNSRTLYPYPGSGIEIRCEVIRNHHDIIITVPLEKSTQKITEIIREYKECFCTKHFTTGIVLKTYPVEPVFEVNPDTGEYMVETPTEFNIRLKAYKLWFVTGRHKYDIELCTSSPYMYIQIGPVYDAGHARYNPGQVVLVSFGQEMPVWELLNPPVSETDCSRDCLMLGLPFEYFIVSPIHSTDAMQKWRVDTEEKTVQIWQPTRSQIR